MMTKTKEIFTKFKLEYQGYRLLKLYSPEILPRIYLSIDEKGCFGFLLRTESKQKLPSSSTKISINFKIIDGHRHIEINLLESRHEDIFATICEDFVHSIASIEDQNLQASKLTSRFISWCDIFKRLGNSSLTPQEQIGLFGELQFLKNSIQYNPNKDHYEIIQSWIGSEGEEQDFKHENNLHEIKCVTTRRSFSVTINSERQLEFEENEVLKLVVFIVDKQQGCEKTLNTIIAQIREKLTNHPVALNLFEYKLINVGYFDDDFSLYENTDYQIRETHFYSVINSFPRIVEKNISSPIFQVKYQLQLEGIQDFRINEDYTL